MPTQSDGHSRLTLIQWLICIIAVIGFAFDTYELLMLPLILRPALMEFGIQPGSPEFSTWSSLLFFVPAVAGGIFGLLGGYLTDRLGRRRVLTWSILIYACSAFAAGYSTSPAMLLVLRTTTFIGVCVEFVAAVAWLAELFPEYERRERVLGYTQAFSSIGGLLVAFANSLAVSWSASLPEICLPQSLFYWFGPIVETHAAWRYTLMSGLIPAIPLIVLRPFLPESPAWREKKAAGTLRRPSIAELFAPELRRTTIITTVMVALSFGAAFGAIQQMPQIAPGMPEVAAAVKIKLASDEVHMVEERQLSNPDVQNMLKDKSPEEQQKIIDRERQKVQKRFAGPIEQSAAAGYMKVQEIGGLVGRFLLALLILRIASRRALLRVFQIPGLIVLPLAFGYLALNNRPLLDLGRWHVTAFDIGIFLAGVFTVGQFSFWGNYLPRVYPLHLRGTGESFAANVGGRMFGTLFAALATTIGKGDAVIMAYTAAGLGCTVYLLGLGFSFFLPEPKQELLQD